MARDITKLHPWLQYKISLLQKECKKKGLKLGIGECFRTGEEQDRLYAQGRTAPGKIVTNARGSSYSSQHQWGVAFDIFQNIKGREYETDFINKVAEIAKSSKVGLGWGGDWKSFRDAPHFYLKKWGSTTSKLRRQYRTPAEFQKTWKGKLAAKTYLRKKKSFTSKRLRTIKKGKTVQILWRSKLGYTKVRYDGVVGYIPTKNIAGS